MKKETQIEKLFSFILIKVLHISKINITFISDYNTKK